MLKTSGFLFMENKDAYVYIFEWYPENYDRPSHSYIVEIPGKAFSESIEEVSDNIRKGLAKFKEELQRDGIIVEAWNQALKEIENG